MPGCPFCLKVIHYLKENEISIPLKDTSSFPEFREELLKKGGKTQVPCLFIGDIAKYESDDIIDWLKENYKK